MKIQTVLISAALILVSGCDKKTDDASDSSIQQQKQLPEALDKIDETYQKQVKQQEADSAKMMAKQEETHKKYVDLIARNETLLKQQEDSAIRWGKILATWERQQEQYQKHLDSLEK
ncbi:MAG: hypothetical protein ABI042_01920 [Verrucomicrobiota bacterium]